MSESSREFRQATFVMYNCARLAKLFENFEKNVLKGENKQNSHRWKTHVKQIIIKGFNNLADMVCELGYQGEGLCNVQHIRGCSVLTLVNNAISAHRTLLTDTLTSGQLYLQ